MFLGRGFAILALVLSLSACERSGSALNGYVEGEFVRVAPTTGGILEKLYVERGGMVEEGAPLFSLEPTRTATESAAARAELAAAEARLADLTKGKRPEEINVIKKQREQAEAELKNAEKQYRRSQALAKDGYTPKAQLDIDRAAFESAKARVAELAAQLETAGLAAREDEIEAARADVARAQERLRQAEKLVAEAAPKSPVSGLVQDTYYRPGEFVEAGRAVVSILPPENVKIRFFIPQALLPRVQAGTKISVTCDGCGGDIPARVVYVSSQAEFTPPVIYSVGSRDKLVFMVEAKPGTHDARLRPGLPVDIRIADE